MKTLCRTKSIVLLLILLSISTTMHATDSDEKKTFILIHGSWHSAWNWYKVTPLLEAQGHTVYSFDLPGMGRDKTPIKDVKFETTVQKICDLIDTIEGKVILVGHSKNGILVSQIAEYRPNKIEKSIYLAAVLVPDGKSAIDLFKLDKDEILGNHITYHPETNSSSLDAAIFKEGLYHDCDDDITKMAKTILSNEPRESATAKLRLTDENYGSVPRYYIECTEDRAITPWLQKKMYTEISCEKVYQIASSHSPFFSMPEKLTAIICEIAYL